MQDEDSECLELGVLYRMSEDDGVDEAHEHDMRQLRKEQLHADISSEEAAEEMELKLDEEWFYDQDPFYD